jgi:hypothetical protein
MVERPTLSHAQRTLPEIHGALLRRANDGDVMNALNLKFFHRALLTSTNSVACPSSM